MTVESEADLRGLMQIGRVVGQTLRTMQERMRPGMTTAEVDAIAEAMLKQHGARLALRLTYNFPGVACISVNDEATHGIPGDRVIRAGDLVKLDLSAELGGYFADAAITVAMPPITPRQRKLCDCTRAVINTAIAVARAGRQVSVIGRASEDTARRYGFSIIRDLSGHGVGRALHEAPTVPTFYTPRANARLTEGLVITIEPHVAMGSGRIDTAADGWTLKTRDGSQVANYEHTVVITRERAIVVTAV